MKPLEKEINFFLAPKYFKLKLKFSMAILRANASCVIGTAPSSRGLEGLFESVFFLWIWHLVLYLTYSRYDIAMTDLLFFLLLICNDCFNYCVPWKLFQLMNENGWTVLVIFKKNQGYLKVFLKYWKWHLCKRSHLYYFEKTNTISTWKKSPLWIYSVFFIKLIVLNVPLGLP